MCAQPCRLPYTLDGQKAYHLSTADLCAVHLLKELGEAGVTALKIEGRMKRREYVGVVVSQYRRALDAMHEKKAYDLEAGMLELKKIYNRGGFCEGYLTGSRSVTAIDRQNHMGVYAGRIERVSNGHGWVKPALPLSKGDGVEFFGDSSKGGMTLAFADKRDGSTVIPVTSGTRVGDEIYLTSDTAQMERVQTEDGFKIPVDMVLRLDEGKSAVLTVSTQRFYREVRGVVLERAQKPINVRVIEESLGKTGGTFFETRRIEIEQSGNPFIALKDVNDLRRRALDGLKEQMVPALRPYPHIERTRERICKPMGTSPYVCALVRTPGQAKAAFASGVRLVYMEPEEYTDDVFKAFKEFKFKQSVNIEPDEAGALQNVSNKSYNESYALMLALPPFLNDEDEALVQGLLEQYGAFDGLLAGSIGQIAFGKRFSQNVHTDIWLNAANSDALAVLTKMGAQVITLSAEAGIRDIGELTGGIKQVVAYARMPLINLVHCPFKKARGCGNCGGTLTDRIGVDLLQSRVKTAHCLIRLLNPVPTVMTDLPALLKAGISAIRLDFRAENEDTVGCITSAYVKALKRRAKVRLEDLPDCVKIREKRLQPLGDKGRT